MNTSTHVMIGLLAAVVGTVLAVAGLYRAVCDRQAVRRAGVNGLAAYMASAAVRSWLLRLIVQLLLLAFFVITWASVKAVVPPGAADWQALSLDARRWVNTVVAIAVALQSAWDILARQHAGRIAENVEHAVERAENVALIAENERLRIVIQVEREARQ